MDEAISRLTIKCDVAKASSTVETVEFDEADVDRSYPFLSDKDTVSYVRQSKVMFLMRGPPGCGKSTVVRGLQKLYSDIVVCSADDFFLTSGGVYHWDFSKLSEAHEACQQKALDAAENGQIIVIDNTNIRRWEMSSYYNIARHNGYIVIVVTPQTPWALQPDLLALKNMHGISLKMCQGKVGAFQNILPYYWAWFLNQNDSTKLLTLACKYFDMCIDMIPECEQHLRTCFTLGIFMFFYILMHSLWGGLPSVKHLVADMASVRCE